MDYIANTARWHKICCALIQYQENVRYNPIPFYVRAIGVDRLAQQLLAPLGVSRRILGIPHYGPTGQLVEIVLKETPWAAARHHE